MANGMPTQPGDVLILKTSRSVRTHAVGPVCHARQQDFRNQPRIHHLAGLVEAIEIAKTLLTSGRQIFLRNLDTGDWSTVSADLEPKLAGRDGSLGAAWI